MPEPAARRWRWFIAWAFPGACVALSISALAVFTAPLAILGVLVLRRHRIGRDAIGLLAGIGVTVAVIGSLNLDYQACSATSGSLVLPVGEKSIGSSCGGVDGVAWLIAGIVVAAATATFHWATTRPSSNGGTPAAPMVG
jgi:hypothetical protein